MCLHLGTCDRSVFFTGYYCIYALSKDSQGDLLQVKCRLDCRLGLFKIFLIDVVRIDDVMIPVMTSLPVGCVRDSF